ncbi:MAG: hypothetical protein NC390_05825 [Fusobacterium sp.]|nr:hypothetical protein [Fusobacterium sp.]
MRTKPLIEQHFHGAFGVDFNTATSDEILEVSRELYNLGVGGIFPTLVTDTIENLKRQISTIKTAHKRQESGMARILGVHLEGVFLNPKKKGIHNEKHFLMPTPENFRELEDEIIKIVTLAPELDLGLIDYLHSRGIKVQAGHCTGGDLSKCDGVTHLFNAMGEINHRDTKTALAALLDDRIYTEIIADGCHLSDDILELVFRTKPIDKILLISDCLPITASDMTEAVFADEEIFYDGERATSKSGTLAGSTKLLPEIVKILGEKGLFTPQLIENSYRYHGISTDKFIEIDEDFNLSAVN